MHRFQIYLEENLQDLLSGWIWFWEVGSWVVQREESKMNPRSLAQVSSFVNVLFIDIGNRRIDSFGERQYFTFRFVEVQVSEGNLRGKICETIGHVGLKFMKENRAINIYLVVISIHDQVEALGVGKTDQGESRLHSMRT